MPEFKYRSRIDAPVEDVFDWHARPGALERLIPPWEDVQVMERQGGLEDGSRTVISLRKGPLRIRWTAQHRDYVEGRQFVDEQVEGPFASWVHAHRFLPEGDDACVIEDEIDYRLPYGALGEWLAGGSVRRDLERSFPFRHRRTADDLARHSVYHDRPRLRIAISGASGLVGTNLSAFLKTGGHRVHRLVRRSPVPGADEIYWDPARGDLDPADLAGLDAMVHLSGRSIGSWRWTPAIKRSIEYSRVASTHLLAETLAGMEAPPPAFICTSAIGYYGDRGDETVDEGSVPGSGFLAELCERWEAATEPARDAGLRVVNLRIGLVLSGAGGVLRRMLTPFNLGLGGELGSGRQVMSWISLDDLLGAVLYALYSDDATGPINLVSPQPVTNREFTRTLGAVLGRPTFARVPAFVLRFLFGEMGQALFLEGARVKPSALSNADYNYLHPDLETALRWELGRGAVRAR
jgi:uncharacterized protein (TIGR01777 family)